MRGGIFNPPAIAHVLGSVLVGSAMITAALQFHAATSRIEARHGDLSAAADPLPERLKRCQLIVPDDATCEATWAENRRRFFTNAPAPAGGPAGEP